MEAKLQYGPEPNLVPPRVSPLQLAARLVAAGKFDLATTNNQLRGRLVRALAQLPFGQSDHLWMQMFHETSAVASRAAAAADFQIDMVGHASFIEARYALDAPDGDHAAVRAYAVTAAMEFAAIYGQRVYQFSKISVATRPDWWFSFTTRIVTLMLTLSASLVGLAWSILGWTQWGIVAAPTAALLPWAAAWAYRGFNSRKMRSEYENLDFEARLAASHAGEFLDLLGV